MSNENLFTYCKKFSQNIWANRILFYNFVVDVASNIDKHARPKLHLFTFFPEENK